MLETVPKNLLYRNQYLLAPGPIDCPFLHNTVRIKQSAVLYTHVDLQVTEYSHNGTRLILLGDLFDHEPDHKSNREILFHLINESFLHLLEQLGRYTGRFVLFYVRGSDLKVVHDTMASMKIYYCMTGDGTWCASQPHLLAKATGKEQTSDESKLSFYSSDRYIQLANSNVGDTTRYDGIRQVLPNHFFDASSCIAIRYWPNENQRKESLSIRECAALTAPMIKGYMENIASRYRVMLPVTAGKDSRTLLAAATDIRHELFFYVNRTERHSEKNKDIALPRKLFDQLGLDFHVLDLRSFKVDPAFESVYFQNNPYASKTYLPLIYNYYLNFSDRVNLPGNVATGSAWFYPTRRKKLDGAMLAKENGVEQFRFAVENYASWLAGCEGVCSQTGFHPAELFYWEERLGNWGTQIQLEKDIAQNDINPFNSRELVRLILSVQPDYAIELGRYPLTSATIKLLWPEVLKVPINPDNMNTALALLWDLGLQGFFYAHKYR